ncbi:macro domain-containing protein [Candidatus Frankia meridionalis]|uniref:macro domain-containing protein n=1 Tax=Candidatus Protofrankia datiscae TaxID=2716812 RepID=UPI000A0123CC
MGGGVSAAIRAAAGNALMLDAAKSVPCKVGDVVVTTAGALRARYIFHAITIGPDGSEAARDVVRRATRRCLELATALNVSSISFPALGTGAAGFSMEDSAVAMTEVMADYVRLTSRPLDIDLYFFPRENSSPIGYVRFYEEFARRVPIAEEVASGVSHS